MASTSTSTSPSSSIVPSSRHPLANRSVEPQSAGTFDIFLSHSGAQKGFAKDLHKVLSPLYNVFFDITSYSLPPAEPFPVHIFHAAKTCRLALVVLSNEFVCSKWPMLELSAFVDASTEGKILPLFYELSPNDLKDKRKLEEWRKRWEELASKDSRINVSLWAQALQRLCSTNGRTFNKLDGELAYLEGIVSAISGILPPLIKSSDVGIQGADRLCKVFIDKFEELERRPSNLPTVYVLGVYGFPGSGKTTLCACLRNRFLSLFAVRALHVKLPTNPNSAELLKSAKELLELTDYHHYYREELISDLRQVYSVLQCSNLRRSRVFLVIDNISSQDSIELVESILQFGVGAGSRVMLVARTREILGPLLSFHKDSSKEPNHYVCDSMRVPSVNENEAIRILMQRGGGLGLAADYSFEMEDCSSHHKEIMTRVARACAFGNKPPIHVPQDLLYLPLALKIIGSQLRSNGMDLEKWERQLSRFEAMLKELREEAVRKIVEECFDKLSDKLKLLFLDVALFMVAYFYYNKIKYEAAVELLSFMHESSQDTIKREINDLSRLCFLDLGPCSDEISVHDIFLEFAKSLSDASSMYYCSSRETAVVQVRAELCMMVGKSRAGLRALILQLDEGCEEFEFPAGFASVKVVILRKCKSLAVLGLTGLTSLVSLEIEDCPRLRYVERDPNHTYTLKSVKWAKGGDCEHASDQQQQGSFTQSIPGVQEGSAMQIKQLMKKGWYTMVQTFKGWPQRPLHGAMSIASQSKALQVLRLRGTGITSLGDVSSCWPQLRVLEVLENQLEQMELGSLPNLKQFFLGGSSGWDFLSSHNVTFIHSVKKSEPRMCMKSSCIAAYTDSVVKSEPRIRRESNLLAGCPELEEVRICNPACEDGMGTLAILSPNLCTLCLKHIHHGEPVLPDFTSSAHSLG